MELDYRNFQFVSRVCVLGFEQFSLQHANASFFTLGRGYISPLLIEGRHTSNTMTMKLHNKPYNYMGTATKYGWCDFPTKYTYREARMHIFPTQPIDHLCYQKYHRTSFQLQLRYFHFFTLQTHIYIIPPYHIYEDFKCAY